MINLWNIYVAYGCVTTGSAGYSKRGNLGDLDNCCWYHEQQVGVWATKPLSAKENDRLSTPFTLTIFNREYVAKLESKTKREMCQKTREIMENEADKDRISRDECEDRRENTA